MYIKFRLKELDTIKGESKIRLTCIGAMCARNEAFCPSGRVSLYAASILISWASLPSIAFDVPKILGTRQQSK
jgi:hypothetical protein